MPRMASDLSFAQRPVPPPRLCPVCASEVDITSRHVTVQGSAVRIYCSAECMRGEGIADELVEAKPAAAAGGWLRPVVGGTALLGVLFRIAGHENGAPSLLTEAAPGVVRGASPKRTKSGRSRRERVKTAPTASEPTPSEDSAPEAPPTGSDR